jgi:hypothetical protein
MNRRYMDRRRVNLALAVLRLVPRDAPGAEDWAQSALPGAVPKGLIL